MLTWPPLVRRSSVRGDAVEERQNAMAVVAASPPSPQPRSYELSNLSNLYVSMSRMNRYRSQGLAMTASNTVDVVVVGIPVAMNVVHVRHNRIPWLTAHPVGRLIDIDIAPRPEEMEEVD